MKKRFDLLGIQAAMMGFEQYLLQPGTEESLASSKANFAGTACYDQPSATHRFEYFVVLQLPVGACDRVWVDRQLAGQLPHARHHLARGQYAVGDREFYLANDLVVDRQAVVGSDVEEHEGRARSLGLRVERQGSHADRTNVLVQ